MDGKILVTGATGLITCCLAMWVVVAVDLVIGHLFTEVPDGVGVAMVLTSFLFIGLSGLGAGVALLYKIDRD